MTKRTPKILEIKSDKKELAKVEKALRHVFEENNLDIDNFNKVLLCVSEAVINSIEHGNKNDSNKVVSIVIHCWDGKVCVEIKDEGDGFDHEQVKDPTNKSNILKESGRGIHIIKSFVENLQFNDSGNSVQLKIKCQ